MEVLIGTSGWIYKDWAKRFYPKDIKNADKLAYFAQHFPTVEVNNTFYRLPSEEAVQNWYAQTPDNFVFTVKLSRYLTHQLRLTPGPRFNDGLKNYFGRVRYLKNKLGCVLVQLPANFQAKPARIENLASQISRLEKKYDLKLPLATEFRHETWFTSEILSMLSDLGIANVIASGPAKWPENRTVTTDFCFLRFHGSTSLYASSYSDRELKDWAAFIKNHAGHCRRVFGYFNNDHSAKAVENAMTLSDLLKK